MLVSPAFGGDVAAPTLREAAGHRLLIGTALSAANLDDPALTQLVATQFDCLTATNAMKPMHLQAVHGTFTFEAADRLVAFAHAHDMQMIGHTLCWHQQSPAWLFKDERGRPLPREVALANLKEHIQAVVKHFAGKVKGWDVVNEALSESPGPDLRDTPARRAIGDDYVVKAFEYAHEADPNVELYYNDFNIEQSFKRERALRLIQQIRAAGLPVNGVGIQGHWLLDSPDMSEIEAGVRAFADAGLNVSITELDIDPCPRRHGTAGADLDAQEQSGMDPYKQGLPDEVQHQLAKRYAELFAMLLKYPQVKRVTFWGATDGDSWLNNWPVRGRTNHPLLWDRQCQPKPALAAVLQALQSKSVAGADLAK